MKKLTAIIILLIITFGMTGCKKGNIHEYEDFINYVDNMECNINDKNYSCNLKNKYQVVSNKNGYDELNEKTRTITFKLNNTDFEFDVISSYGCSGHLDGSCFEYTYELSDSFKGSAFDYYINEYNKTIGYNNELCYKSSSDSCYVGWFKINNNNELMYVINYMEGLLNYLNNLDFKFVDAYENIAIYYDKKYVNGAHYNLSIYFDIVNDKYTYEFRNEYKPSDNSLETYIRNYMKDKEIVLEGV